jgi:hypothetical protein
MPKTSSAQHSFARRGRVWPVSHCRANANDAERYQRDFLPKHAGTGRADWPLPDLGDESQEVALAFVAKTTPDLFVFEAGGVLRCGTGPGSSRTSARLGPSRLGEQTRAGAGGAGATARSGSTKTPFCNMPRFLRTMSPLLLRGLRPLVTGNPRRRWGLDLVRSRPQRAPWSALSRRQWTTPLAARCPVFMGYCGVHSAEFGPVWAGDLGRSGPAAPTALASWHPDL